MNYYNPNQYGQPYFNPYQNSLTGNSFQNLQQAMQLIKVNGIDGAKAYAMSPNSSVALFHESENLMYIKTTDGAGFPTIRTFKFDEVTGAENNNAGAGVDMSKYVTRDEFYNAIKGVINGEPTISTEHTTEGK